MVLPIDASIPFPPPSGSVCRPSASSMIASKASPAEPNQSISKKGQTVHDMLHIEQIIMGAVVFMPNIHKVQHFMQCTRKHMKATWSPPSGTALEDPTVALTCLNLLERWPLALTHDMQVCKVAIGDRQYLQGEWAFLQQADIGRAPWKGPQQRPATGLGSDGRRCPHLQLAARSSRL